MTVLNKAHYAELGQRSFRSGQEVVAFGAPRSWQHKAWQDGYKAEKQRWREQCGPDTLQRGAYNLCLNPSVSTASGNAGATDLTGCTSTEPFVAR